MMLEVLTTHEAVNFASSMCCIIGTVRATRKHTAPIQIAANRWRLERIVRLCALLWPFDVEALTRYDWPGNVRELQNFLERSVILSPGPTLKAPIEKLAGNASNVVNTATDITFEEAETRHIITVLQQVNWVICGSKGAAKKLGLKRTTLITKMRRLGISRPTLRTA